MTDAAPTPPDFWEEFRRWIYAHFGFLGLAALASVGLIFYVWTHWEDVKKWPGVAWLIERFKRQPTPKADPARFSVMVARLADDEQGEYAKLIAALLAEFEGIQILKLDRTIEIEDAGEYAAGHLAARNYLEESAASVLIWGRVLRLDGKKIPQLYITCSQGGTASPKQYAIESTQEFRLPPLFWMDMAYVLRFLIFSFDDRLNEDRGHFVADRLPEHINRVRYLMTASSDKLAWDSDTRGSIFVMLASALRILGDQTGKNQPLEEAIEFYRAAIIEAPRECTPLRWAMLHINIGVTLQLLGARGSGTEKLEQSVEAYRTALLEITQERIPFAWAVTQNNLGNSLHALGEHVKGTEYFKQAVEAFGETLKVWTREQNPLDWAGTQNNLGNALLAIGERESSLDSMKSAVAAYQNTLMEWTRELVPLEWAMTQNNLGNASLLIGQREADTIQLEQAVVAYNNSLLERTRDRSPFDWALTMTNLGNALKALGELVRGIEFLTQATVIYGKVLNVFTREVFPLQWAVIQNNLANTFWIMGERENRTTLLEQAAAAYGKALEVFHEAGATHYTEISQRSLTRVTELIRERQGK
ncbi:MAG: tetratricopeptide repeat protein [Pseudomonadota bacterium]